MTKVNVCFYIFDECNKLLANIILKQNIPSEATNDEYYELDKSIFPQKFDAVFEVDGYFLSVFTRLLNSSPLYSEMVIRYFLINLKNNSDINEISVKFQLIRPKVEVLDYAWSDRLCNLIIERQELENAMSWLSTLGGAFSALGDSFENCAKVAAKISVQQFKIAFRLGEPPLVARCRLYMSLSLIQLGKLGMAKCLIQEQYELAKIFNDFRLQNMCKGVWAKLQYIYKQRKIKYKKQML